MARKQLKTPVETSVLNEVKSFIEDHMDDMEKNSPGRNEKTNRNIYIEDLANTVIRAAQLVVIKHHDEYMEKIVDHFIKNSKTLENYIGLQVANTIANPAWGPLILAGAASIAPAIFSAFSLAQTAQYTPLVAKDKATPLVIPKP